MPRCREGSDGGVDGVEPAADVGLPLAEVDPLVAVFPTLVVMGHAILIWV